MGELLSLFGAAASGGVFGGLAGLARLGLDWIKRRTELAGELAVLRENNRHRELMRDKDREYLQLEVDKEVKVAQAEGDALVESSRLKAVAASFETDRATFATGEEAKNSGWFIAVDFARGMIRPVITVIFDMALFALWGVLVWLMWDYIKALLIAKDQATVKTMTDMLLEITKAIIFIALSATSYWFVARREGKGNG